MNQHEPAVQQQLSVSPHVEVNTSPGAVLDGVLMLASE